MRESHYLIYEPVGLRYYFPWRSQQARERENIYLLDPL